MKPTIVEQANTTRVRVTFALICVLPYPGCIWEREDKRPVDLGVAAETASRAEAALWGGTVGARGYFDNMGPLPVRGYGLVVGLGRNGSRDCPRRIREPLVKALYQQQHRLADRRVGAHQIAPEELIDDLDTAVVIVQGAIPPGAVKGTAIDVAVQAFPGTQTKSLRGGRLRPVDLHRFRVAAPRAVVTGKMLARAGGPVFLNPFSDAESATTPNPREGVVLGGGVATTHREIRFVLTEPSYAVAMRIRDRINAQFPGSRPVADATSPSFIELRVPPEFGSDVGHFLALVRSLYLSRDPSFEVTRARMLAEAMVKPGAARGQIALCLEGLGRRALPLLGELYADSDEAVSFSAAVAGLRLGDHIACDAVEMHARNEAGAHRFQAIRALGGAVGMAGAAITLRRLLDDDDPRAAIAAYEALLERGDTAIASKRVGQDSFRLDRVPGGRESFVYVKRTGSRRIALFGNDLECRPPLLYRAPNGSITITAGPGDEELTVMRGVPGTGIVSPPIPAPLELAPLIELMGNEAALDLKGEVVGLGLDYGAVVRAIYHLCADRSIGATFILEQPNALELFGPPRPAGRPESES